ncbi:hypothetical protein KQX54_008593 [Cotesia glomerata]|uniref:Uncharacterized protein n=1 Tax=Cotesia glomerata TaxID=32391 RepID=A0AAV7J6R4_COTGL|nr:hypothetical protein KQX54_008593 [Cotesia glomerata]
MPSQVTRINQPVSSLTCGQVRVQGSQDSGILKVIVVVVSETLILVAVVVQYNSCCMLCIIHRTSQYRDEGYPDGIQTNFASQELIKAKKSSDCRQNRPLPALLAISNPL